MTGGPIIARSGPPESFVAITPSDTSFLDGYQWLYVTGAGNLVLQGRDDASGVTIAIAANTFVPFAAGLVKAATTATGIFGFR